jgi:hypothetical protein
VCNFHIKALTYNNILSALNITTHKSPNNQKIEVIKRMTLGIVYNCKRAIKHYTVRDTKNSPRSSLLFNISFLRSLMRAFPTDEGAILIILPISVSVSP